jgi:hypothetical protein
MDDMNSLSECRLVMAAAQYIGTNASDCGRHPISFEAQPDTTAVIKRTFCKIDNLEIRTQHSLHREYNPVGHCSKSKCTPE